MSEAVVATGILVKRALLATPTVFVTIGEIVSVVPPGFSRNKLDSTTHNDGTESHILGILRQKDPTFVVNYLGDDPTHEDIVADIMANEKNQWQVLFPSGLEFVGPAAVNQFEMQDVPQGDAIQRANVGISWSGPVTMTPV